MRRISSDDCRLPIACGPATFPSHSAFRNSHSACARAFSLVEVVLALGLVSFCLVAVLGLLPVGLKSVKNANEQAGAADVLNAIAEGVRTARTTNHINYSNSFAGKPISYAIGGSPVIVAWTNLTMEGAMESAESPKRLSAVVNITPPTNSTSPGRASVSVSWSAQANLVWNAETFTWATADGSLTSGIEFLPKP